jgi:UDP-3-O-[3-hydroxymyristoyl] glucosamine N-acyltransferase
VGSAWDGVVRLGPTTLRDLARAYGGAIEGEEASGTTALGRFVPVERAGAGDLAPVLTRRFAGAAVRAAERGAGLLIAAELAGHPDVARLPGWRHPYAPWAMACVLRDRTDVPELEPTFASPRVPLGSHVVCAPRVVLGARVHIGHSSVIGGPGFGWVKGPNGEVMQTPHKGGVIVEDDVYIGPLCTIDAGVLGPTIVRRGAKIDAQVHVGHNCDIGEGTMIAAQCGFAGSVTIGRGVLVGGQAGIADHVTVGDGARIAAKSGVIGDVPAGAVFAGYPAVARASWLRALARTYRDARRR